MSEGITQIRLLLYILILSLLPAIWIAYSYQSSQTRLKRLHAQIETAQQKALFLEQKLAPNRAVQASFIKADRFYLDKQIENLSLLNREVKLLQRLIDNAIVPPDVQLINRLEALKKNRIQFSEGSVETYPFFKEVPDSLAIPVEVDISDIQKILSRIEGVNICQSELPPNRPQLLITDFKLERKRGIKQSELYTLNIKMVQREYFSK